MCVYESSKKRHVAGESIIKTHERGARNTTTNNNDSDNNNGKQPRLTIGLVDVGMNVMIGSGLLGVGGTEVTHSRRSEQGDRLDLLEVVMRMGQGLDRRLAGQLLEPQRSAAIALVDGHLQRTGSLPAELKNHGRG